MKLLARPLAHPIRNLFIFWIGWKLILLLVAACSPGPGYDTSASLLSPTGTRNRELPNVFRHLVNKLTRWDAIYFVKVATRGYLFEQEWFLGWGFTRAIALCTGALEKAGIASYNGLEGLVAICIAHAAHLLSVFALFNLSLVVFPGFPPEYAFTAASLHIISPAGLFLSAPYAESSCALLSFVGCLLFTKSLTSKPYSTANQDLLILASGICFGIATTFRSNGILNGLLLLEEAFRSLFQLRHGLSITVVRRLAATGIAGMSVAAGFLLPQYIAYIKFCGNPDSTEHRPWCGRTLPSIYAFVQDHYWNLGLFRYWTLSNVPLFLLAAPMFVILIQSGLWALSLRKDQKTQQVHQRGTTDKLLKTSDHVRMQVLHNLAIAQLMLALLTLTTAHVQIITRISSAYPVWLWYAAALSRQRNTLLVGLIVKFMVIYAVIQGGLFASFLPPA